MFTWNRPLAETDHNKHKLQYVGRFVGHRRAQARPGWAMLISQVDHQKVVALFSATNFCSYIIELLQLHDTIQIKWTYVWIH